MLRTAGFDIVGHPEDEVYVCRPRERALTEPGGLAERRRDEAPAR